MNWFLGEIEWSKLEESRVNIFKFLIKYLSRISELLENPDYIGINPRERGRSIEYVIQLEENVLIGIKLDYKNEYFYIATMHEISQLKLNQRIKNGRLKSLTT